MTLTQLSPFPNLPLQQAEGVYVALWETTTDAVLVLDIDSNIMMANPAVLQVLGYRPEQLIGNNLSLLQPLYHRQAHTLGLQRYLASGVRTVDWRSTEVMAIHADGSEVPVEISFADIDLDGQRMFVGFFRDITSRKRAEEALFNEKECAQTALRSIADGVITTDTDGCITFINSAAAQLTGWPQDDALGRGCRQVLELVEEGEAGVDRDLVALTISGGSPLQLGVHALAIRRDGEVFSIEGSVAPLHDRNHHPTGAVIAFRDVSLSRRMAAEIRHQACHDPLTGLVNRNEFDRRLRTALKAAGQTGDHYSLLYLDLDQFKIINDTCGHVAGDELLRQVSAILKLPLRKSDVLARLGGDEFGVLLEQTPQAAYEVADALRRAVSEFAFAWKDQRFTVGVSIGQVDFNDASMTPIEILSAADAACYGAKKQGRDRIHVHQP